METVVSQLFQGTYQKRKVLITGHTGFKGSWLSLWLTEMGAEVLGYALAPQSQPNHFESLQLPMQSLLADIRARDNLTKVMVEFKPEIIFHLAALPLVRQSYAEPTQTWDTNLTGTLNVLEAARKCSSVKAIVAVTTDKVYQNKVQFEAYTEQDPLGGYDPYSASKAACEILIESYQRSYFTQSNTALASARAGNVIGGGDWSDDRLIPDIIRASIKGKSTEIRMPDAIRPWQHVLDSLSGYLLLGQHLLNSPSQFSCPWNFGPRPEDCIKVSDLLEAMRKIWSTVQWHPIKQDAKHEMQILRLNSNNAINNLQWLPIWDFQQALKQTTVWYRAFYEQQLCISANQLHEFIQDARTKQVTWAVN